MTIYFYWNNEKRIILRIFIHIILEGDGVGWGLINATSIIKKSLFILFGGGGGTRVALINAKSIILNIFIHIILGGGDGGLNAIYM